MGRKPKRPLILICHASTGSGHKSAAESIALAYQDGILENLKDTKYRNAQIKIVDMIDFCFYAADGNKAAYAYTGKIAPIHDITWRHNFMGRILWGGGTLYSTIGFPKFAKYLKENKPDVVICTHMVAANVAGGVRSKLGMDFPIVSVPTDYETEGLWPHKQTDLFCVSSERMIETLLARRIPKEKIIYTGIPVKPDFAKKFYKKPTRKKLGLPLDKKIAVIIAGAHEPQPYINLRESLNHVITYFVEMDWMHFVFCVGADEKYGNHLKEECRKHKASNIEILGFTDQMAQYISASDIVLCKAGGLTVTECLCCRVPMILIGKAYAQEHINQRFLTYEGVAYHASNYRAIVELLCRITSNRVLYDAAVANEDSLRKPNAAYDVAKAALEIAGCKEIDAGAKAARIIYKRGDSRNKEILGLYIGNAPAHRR